MTEKELEHEVLEQLRKLGLDRVLRIPDSRRLEQGKGFPDLMICGPRQVLFVELKDESGRLSREQLQWKYALTAAGQRHTVWRPLNWRNHEIQFELGHIARTS